MGRSSYGVRGEAAGAASGLLSRWELDRMMVLLHSDR